MESHTSRYVPRKIEKKKLTLEIPGLNNDVSNKSLGNSAGKKPPGSAVINGTKAKRLNLITSKNNKSFKMNMQESLSLTFDKPIYVESKKSSLLHRRKEAPTSPLRKSVFIDKQKYYFAPYNEDHNLK